MWWKKSRKKEGNIKEGDQTLGSIHVQLHPPPQNCQIFYNNNKQ